MLYFMNIAQAGYCSGHTPFVFFSRAQIFLKFAGDNFPERNCLNNPLLTEAGTLFRYFSVLLARAFDPCRKGVIENPIPAADKTVTNPSKS
jgi:hypothetical protein